VRAYVISREVKQHDRALREKKQSNAKRRSCWADGVAFGSGSGQGMSLVNKSEISVLRAASDDCIMLRTGIQESRQTNKQTNSKKLWNPTEAIEDCAME
jgi:hypothetical protein